MRLQRDSNPWHPRYRCDDLPTELWRLAGSRSSASSIYTLSLLIFFILSSLIWSLPYTHCIILFIIWASSAQTDTVELPHFNNNNNNNKNKNRNDKKSQRKIWSSNGGLSYISLAFPNEEHVCLFVCVVSNTTSYSVWLVQGLITAILSSMCSLLLHTIITTFWY